MLAPTLHRFSAGDYHRMAEAGVFAPDARVELLDGRINSMSPIGPLHGGVVKRLSRIFQLQAKGRWIVSIQDPLHLDAHSEPEPDVMLLRSRPDDYTTGHPVPDDVLLLIEVADSSLDYDREEKLPLYARAGIQEVWIVNLLETSVEVHLEPAFSGYGRSTTFRPGTFLSPTAFPDLALNLADLFRR